MWEIIKFKTREKMNNWISENQHKITWEEVFINNSFGLEYKPLTIIDIK